MRAFWLMNGNINRLRAEVDLRALSTNTANATPEYAEQVRQSLVLELGEITVGGSPLEAKPDPDAVSVLKSLA